ncbi:PQQ-dependent dehydrogenase, methanol/ethanol family [Hyphomicrobium sp. B1]|uniref:PQQ-dependent dehydrogenase, methanol/ethanol family n=1 Tax=Hyphomicrobium sp. B1 TaxID=3075651 RepID=UPI003C2F385C
MPEKQSSASVAFQMPRKTLHSLAVLAACGASALVLPWMAHVQAAEVNTARIVHADKTPGDWLTYGRTYSEQRFSPLKGINDKNAKDLGLAWYANLETNRGQEGTPLAIDGKLFVSTAWSIVKAYDGKTGALLWSYDPLVPRAKGVDGCCDFVNRGVAAWNGKIYIATFDGRLIALDEKTGKPVWSVLTVDPKAPMTLTQAPRVANGRVFLGVSGAEYHIRGYISAYDAETGKLDWRFYTIPGDPSKPFENKAMEMAAKTWDGEWWKVGGGGSVWDAISYDPELNYVYFGTGNGLEWNHAVRSRGEGDNLFVSSIIALKADTGEYVWHYQVTPGEEWDYDAVQQLMQADLKIHGRTRKVLMQANKNGFFYVLDRKTGKLISANNFIPQTWAKGIDMRTGRPIENPEVRYDQTGKQVTILPGPLGGHSWQAMSYSPKTGFVYIPTQEIPWFYGPDKNYKTQVQGWNLATASGASPDQPVKGYLQAWDPVKQKEAWRVPHRGPWNGGTLATAGNLVFQGTAAGDINAYRADNGQQLWLFDTQSAVIAPPMTYAVDGVQYVAVLVGWGGAYPLMEGVNSNASGNLRNISRLMVFKVGGTAKLPPLPPESKFVLNPPPETASPETVAKGEALFDQFCAVCHGGGVVSGRVNPDLRASRFLKDDAWFDILLKGGLQNAGMASFAKVLNHDDAAAIRAYVIHRANVDKDTGNAAP